MVLNSRSYGGISTYSDHKLVKMNFSLKWWKPKINEKPKKSLDIPKLCKKEVQKEYQNNIQNKYNTDINIYEHPEDIWTRITMTC